jgi:hypothetical protein
MSGIVNRRLSEDENYSGRAIEAGEKVVRYLGCTYGCITLGGIAVTFSLDGSEPFFEVPEDSVDWSHAHEHR